MNEMDFLTLNTGDIVKHKLSGDTFEDWKKNSYVVTANYGGRITAVRTVDITNPGEWDLIAKAEMYPKDIDDERP